MSRETLHRSLSGHFVDLAVKRGVQGNTSHGRQDKSADPGRAYVVGCAELFRHLRKFPCWRFPQNPKRFQCPKRHRSLFSAGTSR